MAKNTWLSQGWEIDVPAGIYLLKVDNRNTRTRCQNMFKVSNKGTINDAKRRYGVFIVNFGHISPFVLVFLLLTLNM